MTTTISPNAFCKLTADEQARVPGITEQTKKYWSQYCKLKKKIENQPMPSHKSLKQGAEEAFKNMLENLVSPQALEFLGAIKGTTILYKTVKKAVAKTLREGLSDEVRNAAEDFIRNGGDEAVANAASVTEEIADNVAFIDISVAIEAGYDVGDMITAGLFALFDLIGEVFEAAMVVQIIGMVLDAWDPCDLNSQLTADQLQNFSQSFNDQFRLGILGQIGATRDSYGRTILNGIWPVQYYADQTILQPYKKKEYKKIKMQLQLSYLNNLEFNSCGQPIPKTRAGGGSLWSQETITGFDKDTLIFFSDGNTVAANWLYKWWPVLLGIIIVLIVLFLAIKKRQTT